MKTMVIYDSQFGNTGKIAQAIGSALGSEEEVKVLRVADVQPECLPGIGLLIIGSPTQRFRPTMATTAFLKGIPEDSLEGISIAAFDTRFTMEEIEKSRVLPFFVRMFGYAAKPIADSLEGKGGERVIPPEGFYVEGIEGPLMEGELERAAEWAKQIRELINSPDIRIETTP